MGSAVAIVDDVQSFCGTGDATAVDGVDSCGYGLLRLWSLHCSDDVGLKAVDGVVAAVLEWQVCRLRRAVVAEDDP